MPALTLAVPALFPERSGLAASLQGFVQMVEFALVSGLLAPLLFDSALCWWRAGSRAAPEKEVAVPRQSF